MASVLREIAEVEAQCGVALPLEYRTFLAEVGAGGPGPGAVTPLRRIEEKWVDQQIATLRAAGHEPTTRDDEDDYFYAYLEVFGGAAFER